MIGGLTVQALPGVPEIGTGADLAAIVCTAIAQAGLCLQPFDILVVAQKIISKAEGRGVRLDSVEPDIEARRLAKVCCKDPRLVALILQEARSILVARPDLLIVEHHSGHIMANAGIDSSNAGPNSGLDETVLLLPVDADASARRLSDGVAALTGQRMAVVVSDSFGRPWRLGTTNVSLGCYGLSALQDLRGRPDRQGRTLKVSQVGLADCVAAAAGLVMGEGAEGLPLVIVRGLAYSWDEKGIGPVFRAAADDAFR